MGFKRCVLARELSVDEIKHICKNVNIEIEVFIHGALCICYSGQCLMSSIIGGRSGNRGKCAGTCRLPYSLLNNGKETDKGYLLRKTAQPWRFSTGYLKGKLGKDMMYKYRPNHIGIYIGTVEHYNPNKGYAKINLQKN